MSLQNPVVYDRIEIHCKWCLGIVRRYFSKVRRKESSCDFGRLHIKWDYHEGCWAEAIEVQI